jgi:hypothetical protein
MRPQPCRPKGFGAQTERHRGRDGGSAEGPDLSREPHGPRLFEGPVLLRRTRRNLAELMGLAWLVLEVAQHLRSRGRRS